MAEDPVDPGSDAQEPSDAQESAAAQEPSGAQEPAAAQEPPEAQEPAAAPTVICDDVHVVYRVMGRRRAKSGAPPPRRRLRGRNKNLVTRKVHAVRGVSMVAREGDAIGLIGRNGSGKSTLLRAIAGLLPAEEGHVFTAGRPTLLGVNAALMRDLPGEDNILLGGMAMGLTREEAQARRDWIVEFADLGEFISLPMRAYSSGMAARLRFAIAASTSHEILMIDEALATGDAEFRRRSEKRIMELRQEAGTVFLVSHSLGVVRMTCNRAIWLEKGKVVMDGEANEVVDAYEMMYDPEQDALERKQRRAKRRRQRSGMTKAERRAARAAKAERQEAAPAPGTDPTPAEAAAKESATAPSTPAEPGATEPPAEPTPPPMPPAADSDSPPTDPPGPERPS